MSGIAYARKPRHFELLEAAMLQLMTRFGRVVGIQEEVGCQKFEDLTAYLQCDDIPRTSACWGRD